MKQKKFYAFFGFEKLKKIAFHSLGISISLVFSLLLNSKGQKKKKKKQFTLLRGFYCEIFCSSTIGFSCCSNFAELGQSFFLKIDYNYKIDCI